MQLPVRGSLWREAPFIRLLIPLIAGIVIQVYSHLPAKVGWVILMGSLVVMVVLSFYKLAVQYRLRHYHGICIQALLFATGLLLALHNNIQNNPAWINNFYCKGNSVLVTLEEPLSEKANSFKANAAVRAVIRGNGEAVFVKGNVLLYFQKDSSLSNLHYGSQLVFKKILQPIQNSGNPGSFNYQRYCDFRDISNYVFLKPGEFVVLKIDNQNLFKKFLFAIRSKLVEILSKNINGEKEAGLAEAMLIGYKDDLDKNLVQSYSNTGVVHIIAISGLHLGLIYALLSFLCRPFNGYNTVKWLKPVIIISGLWLFSLAAGGSPSILRAAVMFTCLVTGNSLVRKASLYQSLAASAFLLLCYNPYWLWDAGFQLSYAALLSIALFMKPVYNRLYFQNKILDAVWKLMAVTIAAQVLAVPVCLYHFQQFPVYFLIANLLAVPLSSLILLVEILLCVLSFIPVVAKMPGMLLHWLIYFLNSFIEWIDQLPYSTLEGFQINTAQLLLLYLFIAGIAAWLLQKKKSGIIIGLSSFLVFSGIRAFSFYHAARQQQLIVYNIPRYQAIDFICGRKYVFKGDSALLQDDLLQRFHLKPSRTLNRISSANSLPNLSATAHFASFAGKVILIADSTLRLKKRQQAIVIDILLLTRNPQLYLCQFTQIIKPKQVIIDAANPEWKIRRWKQECVQLDLPCHTVTDDGAFVLTLH